MTTEQQAMEAIRVCLGLLALCFLWFVLYRNLFDDQLDQKICELDASLDALFMEAYQNGFKGFAREPHFELRKRVWLLYGGRSSLGIGLYFLILAFRNTRLFTDETDYQKIALKIRDHGMRERYLEIHEQLLYAIGVRLVHFGFLARRLKHVDLLVIHYRRLSELRVFEADS